MIASVLQSDFGKELQGPATGLLSFFPGDPTGHHGVLESREVRQELMELKDEAERPVAKACELSVPQQSNIGPSDLDRARIGPIERSEQIDTAEAFHMLGFKPDPRAYDLATEALTALGVGPEIVLATNNPKKIDEVEKHGFKVSSRFQLECKTNPEIDKYLEMKRQVLDHYEAD